MSAIACVSLAGVSIAIGSLSGDLPRTSALFSDAQTGAAHSFAGATFSPSVAPATGAALNSADVVLVWDPVSITSGATVSYRVSRTNQDSVVESVCLGSDAPVLSAGRVTCTDRTGRADAVYRYAVTPFVAREGVDTWSRPSGEPSAQILVPRIVYAETGAIVATTLPGNATVPFPPGTTVGDVLVLVSINGLPSAPPTPAGWSELARVAVSGSDAMSLFVAWRVADTSSSVQINPLASASGAVSYVMRFARVAGNTDTPVVATPVVVAGEASPSPVFRPTPDPVTVGTNSTVVSLVATHSTSSVTLAQDRGFVLRQAGTRSPRSEDLTWGVATSRGVAPGVVPAPDWAQVDAIGPWAYATFAFR